MKKECEFIPLGKKPEKAIISIQTDKLVISLKRQKVTFTYKEIISFEDSLTTTEESLEGLSFLLVTKKGKYLIYLSGKKETEETFKNFVDRIRRKFPQKKKDVTKFYGTYKPHRRAVYIFVGLFIISGIFLVSEILQRADQIEIFSWILLSGFFLWAWLFYSPCTIHVDNSSVTFSNFLGNNKIPFHLCTKFTKKNEGNGIVYTIYYKKHNSIRKKRIRYHNFSNISQLLQALKHKLKGIPQVEISGLFNKKEKPWPLNHTY